MKAKILVCHHKAGDVFANEILQPILLNAANASAATISALESACAAQGAKLLRDDFGENISHLNPYFCELTALYSAWKNPQILENADFVGLFHYRRVLDFRGKKIKNRNDINFTRIAPQNIIKSFNLTQHALESNLARAEILVPKRIILPLGYDLALFLTQAEIFARDHYAHDLETTLEILREQFPQMERATRQVFFTRGAYLSWCNMFVMQREIFDEYCAFLFSVLFAAQKRVSVEFYSPYQARVFGFLAERLTNVFIVHKEMTSSARIKHLNLWLLKPRRPWFGFQIEGETRRFFFLKLRVWKERVNA